MHNHGHVLCLADDVGARCCHSLAVSVSTTSDRARVGLVRSRKAVIERVGYRFATQSTSSMNVSSARKTTTGSAARSRIGSSLGPRREG